MRITLAVLLLLSNVGWFWFARNLEQNAVEHAAYQNRIVLKYQRENENLYYENEANDRAATECAEKTGFRYNCADGTQRVSCQELGKNLGQ
jgi:hypothetical protein